MRQKPVVLYISTGFRVLLRKNLGASGGTFPAVPHGMPYILREISTEELRCNFSETINRAAYGCEPIFVTRHGRKVAAIISIDDAGFVLEMRERREEARAKTRRFFDFS